MGATTTSRVLLTLVLGGTRSGKSRIAEGLAADLAGAPGRLTYIATAAVDPADADHTARITAHRVRRPASWTTVECPDPARLAAALADTPGPVLLDSLGTWVAGHPDLVIDGAELASALRARTDPTVVVSEEVGWSLHASTALGRRFVDAVGTVNQDVAAVADRVLLVVAGRVLELPPC